MRPARRNGGFLVSQLPPCYDPCRRARSRPYRPSIVATDGKHLAAPEHLDDLKDVVRHHPDNAGTWTARGMPHMRPLAGHGEVSGAIDAGVALHPDPAPRDAVTPVVAYAQRTMI